MNRDAIETLYVLALAGWVGWELHKRLAGAPQMVFLPGAPLAPHDPRAARVLCRCQKCAPPFNQEGPSEAQ